MNNLHEEIYRIIDSFLVEAKDQNGNDRSLERLNQDRHLAAERFKELFTRVHNAAVEIIQKEYEAMEEKLGYYCELVKKVKEDMARTVRMFNEKLDDGELLAAYKERDRILGALESLDRIKEKLQSLKDK